MRTIAASLWMFPVLFPDVMIRFAAILLTILGLALGPASGVLFAAPLCAAPGEASCSCAQATTAACCTATAKSCCSVSHGACCDGSDAGQHLIGSTCDGCKCCLEPTDNPLAPGNASEIHSPVDLLVFWSAPVATQPASLDPSRGRDDFKAGATVSLQVLHCRWRN
ncbi:hypothetical protein [Blastopirellula marina]|uniref:hypothetical protein n=1 Tax=Blastopirellula marina TaxID=124 RepID=UPI0011B066C3|nr:hypothetical protein [Blastopirellula marina]